MTYVKNVCGTKVVMTQEEQIARQAEEDLWARKATQRQLLSGLRATDSKLPRYVEDLIDTMDALVPFVDNLPTEILQVYQSKKQLRSELQQELEVQNGGTITRT